MFSSIRYSLAQKVYATIYPEKSKKFFLQKTEVGDRREIEIQLFASDSMVIELIFILLSIYYIILNKTILFWGIVPLWQSLLLHIFTVAFSLFLSPAVGLEIVGAIT